MQIAPIRGGPRQDNEERAGRGRTGWRVRRRRPVGVADQKADLEKPLTDRFPSEVRVVVDVEVELVHL